MGTGTWSWELKLVFIVLISLLFAAAAPLFAQNAPDPTAAPPPLENPAPSTVRTDHPRYEHKFWDKENGLLFGGVAASRTLDYFSTLNMRRRGRQEIFLTNDVVDNHAAFATIEAASIGVSIGASYLFHRYGHHRLERWTSYVHIGLATSGAVRNYCLKTAHPAPSH